MKYLKETKLVILAKDYLRGLMALKFGNGKKKLCSIISSI